MEHSAERRAHPRIRLKRKVGIYLSSGEVVNAWTYDLSLGGLQVLTDYSADPGDEFDLYLGVVDPANDRYLYLDMRVRIIHMLYDGTAGCFRIGMKIVGFRKEGDREVYERFLESKLGTPLERAG